MDNVLGPFSFFINPEPITVKGLKTFNPHLFYIYGKNGKIPDFQPFAPKKEGCAIGTIYKKATQFQTVKQWMGKVGDIRGIFRNDPNSYRTCTKKELNIDTILEKLAYDLYQELGRGFFLTPKTRLSLQLVLNTFNMTHAMANHWAGNGITETLRIMSSFIPGYSDFAHAMTWDQDKKVSFIDYLAKHHRPPTSILTAEGNSVPIQGLMALLAVGRCLADIDLLGGGALNAGFVWIQKEGEIIGAQAVKIDPGCAFHFTSDAQNFSRNFVINTHRKLGSIEYLLSDLRDLQTSTMNVKTTISWNALTQGQKEEFLSALLNCSRYINSDAVLDLLFYREGKFRHSEVAYMPEDDAKRMQKEMKEWIAWQLEIYCKDLSAFKTTYPEQLLRIKYIDAFGELPLPMSKETYPIRELFTDLMLIAPETDQKQKEPIQLEKLFEGNVKKILLVGNPGTGKSTLCQKVAHDWASGRLFPQFDGVYWLPLRYLNSIPCTEASLEEFFSKAIADLFLNDPNLSPYILGQIKSKRSRILFVLDGFDEANLELKKRIQAFFNNPELHLILSTRPESSHLLKHDRLIENIGFSDQHIKAYSNHFFARQNKGELSALFLQALRKNSVLSQLAHTPLYLQMLCTIWEKSTDKNAIARTLTDLYETMVNQVLAWKSSFLSEDLTQICTHLGQIAAFGLENGKAIIHEGDLKKILNSNYTIQNLLNTGLIKAEEEGNYGFLHLTFQEYLAAYYISRLSLDEQSSFLQMFQTRPEYEPVIIFLCGIIYKNHSENLGWFFNALGIGEDNLRLVFSCLNECDTFFGDIPAIEYFFLNSPVVKKGVVIKDCGLKVFPLSLCFTNQVDALNTNQVHALKWLITKKPDLLIDEQRSTVFIRAAWDGDIELMEFLYKQPGGNSLTQKNYDNPLIFAVISGNKEAIKWLYRQQPELIKKADKLGRTPFYSALKQLEIMIWLCNQDPTVIEERYGYEGTPMHIIVSQGDLEKMAWLYSRDPELINKVDDFGHTPLHVAAYQGHVEAMKWLDSKDPELIKKGGRTLFDRAVSGGHIEAMKWLDSKDPELIKQVNSCRQTSLQYAVIEGQLEAVKWLYSKDAERIKNSVKFWDIFFPSSLYYNETSQQQEIIKWLCSQDPGLIRKCDKYGNTFMHAAAYVGHVRTMEWLCSTFPELINKVNDQGESPMHKAASGGQVEVMELLHSTNPKLIKKVNNLGKNPLHLAAEVGFNFSKEDTLRWLCSKEPKLITQCDKNGSTPLHIAILNSVDKEVRKWLNEQDPEFIKKALGDFSICDAVKHRNRGVIKLLYRQNSDVIKEIDEDGSTLLSIAASYGWIEIVKWLYKRDPGQAKIGSKNGWTPLHDAAFMGSLEPMKWLIEQDQTLLYLRTYKGEKPYDIAKHFHQESAAELLVSYQFQFSQRMCAIL